ncbi:MAG: rRNA processing protein RimM [Humibacillus sp.]|nr:rRNA processing protein RimM [Humibacillus sp.]
MSLVLARIGKPHGLQGEVTVRLHTDEPEVRFAVGCVIATDAAVGSGVPRELTIVATRVHNGVWLLTFEEIPDRTGAESLRGTQLVTSVATPAVDDDDAFYEDDLVGLEARDQSGTVVGTVTGLEIGPAQDRLVLTLTDGVTAYLPFVRHMVPVVAEDHVVVDPPAGLFDLYREGTE